MPFTLLYLWDSLVTLVLISLIPLVGPSFTDPLAVKLPDNQLYMSPDSHMEEFFKVSFVKEGPLTNDVLFKVFVCHAFQLGLILFDRNHIAQSSI